MGRTVARFKRRRRNWKSEAGRTLMTSLAVAGIGWLIVVPAVAGFAVGHWLDVRYGTGIAFGAGLGCLGLTFGCWSAWRRIGSQRDGRRGRREPPP
jgi:ATP synthase protein I